MEDKGKKPALAIMLALGRKKPAEGESDADDGYKPSPECVDCVRHFFEAGADGDYAGAASALSSALDHIDGGEEESEPESAEPEE